MAEGVLSSSSTTTSSCGSQQCKPAARLEETFTFTSGGGERDARQSVPALLLHLGRQGQALTNQAAAVEEWAEPAQRIARYLSLPAAGCRFS